MTTKAFRRSGRIRTLLFGCCLSITALALMKVGYDQSFVVGASQKARGAKVKVAIDVAPGESAKSIDLGSMSDLPVAILSGSNFDATTVDPSTVKFAGAPTMRWDGKPSDSPEVTNELAAGEKTVASQVRASVVDVNGDGKQDLIVYFSIPFLSELSAGDHWVFLTGSTFDGEAVQGTAYVNASGISAIKVPTGDGCTSITCPANVTQGSSSNECGAVVNYPPPTPSGTCDTITCSPASGSLFPVGTTTVTCTSSAGPTCQFTVTVLDIQTPNITCPPNQVRSNDPNQCGAVVNYPPPTVSDNCPGVGTPVCSPASGSFFPVGTTTVTCRVSDATTCENIFAVDTNDNLINFRASAPGSISGSSPISGLGANEDVVGIDFRPATGLLYGLVRDTVTGGLRILIMDVVGGATAQIGSAFTASGTDFGMDFNPTVDRIRITSDAETNLSVHPVTGVVTVQTPLNPGNPNIVGSAYTNNFVGATVTTLYDIDSGNDMLATQNPPANGTLSYTGSLGTDTTGLVGFDISQCGGTAYATLTSAGNTSSLYTINLMSGAATLVGTIGGGNDIRAMSVEMARTQTCTFTVTVNDTQPPMITCPANITTTTPQNVCTPAGQPVCTVVTFPPPTASDNCPGVTVACNPPSGSCFPVGTTTVTCTATDASGNTATCSFTTKVFDVCLQDDATPSTVLLFNSITGDYIFCCQGTTFTGKGKVTRQGCVFTLEHYPLDRRVRATTDKAVFRGNASIQSPPGKLRCNIGDGDIRNNTCVCQ